MGEQVPQQETRGGDRIDWAKAVAGEPLPPLPADAYPEPDSEPLPGGHVIAQAGLAPATGAPGPRDDVQPCLRDDVPGPRDGAQS
jgi:hypothetical protein